MKCKICWAFKHYIVQCKTLYCKKISRNLVKLDTICNQSLILLKYESCYCISCFVYQLWHPCHVLVSTCSMSLGNSLSKCCLLGKLLSMAWLMFLEIKVNSLDVQQYKLNWLMFVNVDYGALIEGNV